MLPESLEVTYDQAMERIDEQGSEVATIARKILSWIFYSFRPLTIKEVQHAIAVEPGDSDFDADGLIDEDVIVSVCAGLVTIQQESNTIGMVHYTTQEYFERKGDSLFRDAKRDIALTCIMYLSFDKFREVGEMCNMRSSKGPLPDPPSNNEWLPENFDQFWWNNWIPENYHPIGGQHGDGPPGGYHLLVYCGRYWADHVRGEFETDFKEEISALLLGKRKLSNLKKVAPSEWDQSDDGLWIQSPSYIRYFSALQMAAFMGLAKTINNLLENGAHTENDLSGYTALHAAVLGIAADRVIREVIACLLDHGADINARNRAGDTALHLTAEIRNPDVLRYLLERGANVNVENIMGRTALIKASPWAEEDILQSLLDKGADVNAKDVLEVSALQHVVASGSLQRVLYLLSSGAEMSSSILHCAAAAPHGGSEIAQCLLDRGADIEGRNVVDQTALHFAVERGNLEIVQYLLARGANIESRRTNGETALHLAIKGEKFEIMQCLLNRGADVSAIDGEGNTVLHSAFDQGGTATAVLIQAGAKVDRQNEKGETPLDTALRSMKEYPSWLKSSYFWTAWVANMQRAFLVLLRAAPPNILDVVSYIRPIVTEERLERLKACVRCTELLDSCEEYSEFVPCYTCAADFKRLWKDYVAMEREKGKGGEEEEEEREEEGEEEEEEEKKEEEKEMDSIEEQTET